MPFPPAPAVTFTRVRVTSVEPDTTAPILELPGIASEERKSISDMITLSSNSPLITSAVPVVGATVA
jgi:hypothetical protein